MVGIRAKTRSTRCQRCVKYTSIIIFIKGNTDMNTGDLKILCKKCQNKADCSPEFFNLLYVLPYAWLESYECHGIRVTHCQFSTVFSWPGGYKVYILGSNMPRSQKNRKRLQADFLSLLLSNQKEILKRGMT